MRCSAVSESCVHHKWLASQKLVVSPFYNFNSVKMYTCQRRTRDPEIKENTKQPTRETRAQRTARTQKPRDQSISEDRAASRLLGALLRGEASDYFAEKEWSSVTRDAKLTRKEGSLSRLSTVVVARCLFALPAFLPELEPLLERQRAIGYSVHNRCNPWPVAAAV